MRKNEGDDRKSTEKLKYCIIYLFHLYYFLPNLNLHQIVFFFRMPYIFFILLKN